MTSVLNVDTIADKAGTGPVGLTKQNAPKAHLILDQTGTTELKETLNFSSVTDVGTGLADLFFTNNFSSVSYANTGATDGGSTTQATICNWYNGGNAYRSTAANSIGIRNISNNSHVDRELNALIYCGDLA
jgi:hypothetical protein